MTIYENEQDRELREAREALERLGLVEATSERRQNQIVYRETALSLALRKKYPNEDDFWSAVEALALQREN